MIFVPVNFPVLRLYDIIAIEDTITRQVEFSKWKRRYVHEYALSFQVSKRVLEYDTRVSDAIAGLKASSGRIAGAEIAGELRWTKTDLGHPSIVDIARRPAFQYDARATLILDRGRDGKARA